ncbi:MAG: sulfotransferase [Chloroflexota bacterium]
MPPISPEEVAEAKTFFPLKKFFIFGHARSGTTLLTRLIRLHPEVHCNYQGHFFTRPPLLKSLVSDSQVEAWLCRPSNRWNRGRDLSPVVLRAVSDFILEREARRVGKSVVGDKSPNSLLNGQAVRNLYEVYPDGRLIFIVRDGRDAAVSHRFQNFIDALHHLSKEDQRIRQAFTRDAEPFFQGKRSIFTPQWIRQSAEGWVRNVVETDTAGQELFADRYFALRFEDLLARPFETMCKVWQFLGVDISLPKLEAVITTEMQNNPDEDWQRYKEKELVAGLRKGEPGFWQELFTQRDREVFKQIAGDTLIAWGYEKDMNW